MQPTTLPGRSYVAISTDRISRLLFHLRARDYSLTPLTGQTPTFTRATAGGAVRGRNGMLRTPVHSQPRFEMFDASDVSGLTLTTPGILIEPAATQICPNPQAPASWATFGTPVETTGQVDPFGGSAAVLLADDDAGNREGKQQNLTFTGDGTKTVTFALRAGTAATIELGVRDITAGNIDRHQVRVTWNAGTTAPTLSTILGAGTRFSPIPVYDRTGALWWLVSFSADAVVAANSNAVYAVVGPGATTGTFYLAGANAWNADTPSSWVSAAATARNADALTYAVGFGTALTADNDDFTIYVKLPRPAHASYVGTLGQAFGIMKLGVSATPGLGLYFDTTSRSMVATIDTAGTDAFAPVSIPSGAMIEACAQYSDLTIGGRARLDVGAGFGSLSAATADAFTALADSTLRVGQLNSTQLGGAICDLKIGRGLYTMQQMREAY